jgi:hypothetical protein
MPREFLPPRRRREPRSKAELFPRGETGVVVHSQLSTVHGPRSTGHSVPRQRLKAELRAMAEDGWLREPEHRAE